MPDHFQHPPCGIGLGNTALHNYEVTSVPPKVDCYHCKCWMRKKGIII
jgi:hypothetical protein